MNSILDFSHAKSKVNKIFKELRITRSLNWYSDSFAEVQLSPVITIYPRSLVHFCP